MEVTTKQLLEESSEEGTDESSEEGASESGASITPSKKQKVTIQAATPRGKAAAANISNKSRPDYTFYVLKSSSKVVALVIEAKCTATATALEHASAQAVGYFFNLSLMSLHPPLVIVMTEKFMNIIYFPFKWDNFLLANCVEFRHVPLCKESTILDDNLLGFIILFTNPEGPVLTPKSLPSYGGEMVTKEALECKIETKEESVTALN